MDSVFKWLRRLTFVFISLTLLVIIGVIIALILIF
jgi:hypothetical protein